MKKTNLIQNFNRLVALAVVLSIPSVASAQSFRTPINRFLSDNLIPVIIVIIIGAAITGLLTNLKLIKNQDTMKEGLINMAWIVGVVLIVTVAIGAIVVRATGVSFSI